MDAQRAQPEQARKVKNAAVDTIHGTWRSIQDHHVATTAAMDLIESGLLDDLLTQAISDLAAVQEEAGRGMRSLARIAVTDRNLSARSIAAYANVSHNTILRWLPENDSTA